MFKNTAKAYDKDNKIKSFNFFSFLIYGITTLGFGMAVVVLLWYEQYANVNDWIILIGFSIGMLAMLSCWIKDVRADRLSCKQKKDDSI